MPTRWIPYGKVLVHAVCLLPFVKLIVLYRSGALGLMADPVLYITLLTGYWTLYLLITSLAITPVRRMHPKLGNLIRFRRLLGLYAFFYATLHLSTYLFLFSGYDLSAVLAGLRTGRLSAISDQWRAVWPTILDDLKKRRFIQVGLFAWVLLLTLAVTSPAVVMRWIGGKVWRRVHYAVYVAAIAGCVHYWWLVKKGVREPLPFTLMLAVLLLARMIWTANKRLRRPTPAARTRNATR